MTVCAKHPARAVPCSLCNGLIVYDAAPEIAYDPRRSRAVLPGSAGNVAEHAPAAGLRASGFGNVVTRRMLDTPPPKFPWLTRELAEQELAIGAYQADRVQVALDSIAQETP